eukprot:TRINITY_DN3052_c0_g2_i1.p1 TRINITY_DN3052_c0_g2~~TRINITY_DN3052_c0_g2_i1.p1  ORF type:complete len:576 (-),score=147.14 TRINITY_DN3052_c0_g2_i1:51-1778(-)
MYTNIQNAAPPPTGLPSNTNGGAQPTPTLPPTNQEEQKIIDGLAGFVSRSGPTFENTVRLRERTNPKFSFLYNAGPSYDYYIWKLHCLNNGISPEQGYHLALDYARRYLGYVSPPPQQQFDANENNATGSLTAEELEEFHRILGALEGTKDSIRTAKNWILQHSKEAKAVCQVLQTFTHSLTQSSRRLYVVYLVNDVLCQKKRDKKGENDMFEKFEENTDEVKLIESLQEVVTSLMWLTYHSDSSQNDEVKDKVIRILKLWEQRGVFDKEIVNDMEIMIKEESMPKSLELVLNQRVPVSNTPPQTNPVQEMLPPSTQIPLTQIPTTQISETTIPSTPQNAYYQQHQPPHPQTLPQQTAPYYYQQQQQQQPQQTPPQTYPSTYNPYYSQQHYGNYGPTMQQQAYPYTMPQQMPHYPPYNMTPHQITPQIYGYNSNLETVPIGVLISQIRIGSPQQPFYKPVDPVCLPPGPLSLPDPHNPSLSSLIREFYDLISSDRRRRRDKEWGGRDKDHRRGRDRDRDRDRDRGYREDRYDRDRDRDTRSKFEEKDNRKKRETKFSSSASTSQNEVPPPPNLSK